MTNETTASQPKSIGDDARFWLLLEEIGPTIMGTGMNNFIKYLDSRAPAAQASATIQAAPEGLAAKVRAIAEKWNSTAIKEGFAGNEVAYELLAALGDFDDAATIQEPVMVAEPVLVKCEECDGKGGTVTAEWVDPISGPECEVDLCGVCGGSGVTDQVPLFPAAPMVADPAGVVCGTCDAIGSHRHGCPLAATVKAVPSEALDAFLLAVEMGIEVKFRVDQGYCVVASQSQSTVARGKSAKYVIVNYVPESMFFSDFAPDVSHASYLVDTMKVVRGRVDATISAIKLLASELKSGAAPLADKTGGGE